MIEKDEKPGNRWTGRIFSKYVLIQIPSTVLLILIIFTINQKVGIPPWLFWGIIIGAVIKDIVLFPFVWRSYDSRSTHPMVGARGIAVDHLSPSGYIRIHGQLWQAELKQGYHSLESGKPVLASDVQGINLIVKPE